MDWFDILLDLLCKIYKEWGGDCKDLYEDSPNAPTRVVDEYHTKGAPQLPDQSAKDKYLELLDSLETHLGLPANSLPSADTQALNDMIKGLRNDLG